MLVMCILRGETVKYYNLKISLQWFEQRVLPIMKMYTCTYWPFEEDGNIDLYVCI